MISSSHRVSKTTHLYLPKSTVYTDSNLSITQYIILLSVPCTIIMINAIYGRVCVSGVA